MILARHTGAAAILGIACLLLPSAVSAQNLVQNGGFEINGGTGEVGAVTTLASWSVGSTNDGAPYPFVFVLDKNADSTGFASKFSPPTIKLWGPGQGISNGFNGPAEGSYFLGVDGAYATAPVSQTISGLTAGKTYNLDFKWAASQFTDATGPTTQSWHITFGSDTADTSVYNLPSQGFSGWLDYTTQFTASSASETLTFLASGGPSGLPPFLLLDNVSLTEDVPPPTSTPEPGTLAVATAGIVGFGIARRRKRSAAK